MNKEKTHIVFDGKRINISPNLSTIFNFLAENEKEIKSLFGIEDRFEEFRQYYRDLLKYTKSLLRQMKENNFEPESSSLEKDPRNFTKLLDYTTPVRPQMITLFTQLEVMFFLYIAYTHEVDGEKEIKDFAQNDKERRKFVNKFLLTNENVYYSENCTRFQKLDAGKIIRLRNSLVHFFSLPNDSVGVCSHHFAEDAVDFENYAASQKKGGLVILSPIDLSKLINSANLLLLQQWTEDTYKDNEKFKRKIQYVNKVVTNHAAVIVYKNYKK